MTYTYRLIQPNEEAAAIAFWSALFDCDHDEMYAEYATDPDRFSHTYLAIDSDGRMCATASYCVRSIRDIDGGLQRTGCVWNVATEPHAQRQGLATRLMRMTIDAMIAEGCTWSLVFTSPAGQRMYSHLGYTSVDVPRWGGTLKRCFVQNNTYIVRPYDPRVELNGWEHLADIYLSYNVHRPLTTFRDRRYWTTGYAHHRYTLWLSQQKAIFAAFSRKDQGSPIGYISVDFDDTFQIFELGVMQGHDEARMSLIDTTIQAALQKGYSNGRIWLPHDPESENIVNHFLADMPQQDHEAYLMARALSPTMTAKLESTVTAPHAMQWMIDNF